MQVYTHTKRSLPDLRIPEAFVRSAPAVVHFDSLQSMPLSFEWLPPVPTSSVEAREPKLQPDMAAVEAAATWLRSKLQLRLFGFDVVVDKPSGTLLHCLPDSACLDCPCALRVWILHLSSDLACCRNAAAELRACVAGAHVIIDLNYFPSYAGIAEAPGAVREVIREAVGSSVVAQPS